MNQKTVQNDLVAEGVALEKKEALIDPSAVREMESFVVEVDNGPDLRFYGKVRANVRSYSDKARIGEYSGQVGRHSELSLYETAAGKYVCQRVERTRWSGESDSYDGKVCDTVEQVKEYFGYGWLAQDLYRDAGIDAALTVD
ncbi:MAG: hypothetical protein JSS47_23470 [Proteobacteria bacterium]|nr:hypothetical protein [Pseudomonadota bacterium]